MKETCRDIAVAEKLLREGEAMNPGPWGNHCRVAGMCARRIAQACGMDADLAQVCGMMHDIGRREGNYSMRHIWDGYKFLSAIEGMEVPARTCLTHSFPLQDIGAYSGKNDMSAEDTAFVRDFLNREEYDDYDRLIQLCDALATAEGAIYIEKRLIDVALRHGVNDYTLDKWRAFLRLKDYFDQRAGGDIYALVL